MMSLARGGQCAATLAGRPQAPRTCWSGYGAKASAVLRRSIPLAAPGGRQSGRCAVAQAPPADGAKSLKLDSALHDAIEADIHGVFEKEVENLNEAVHRQFEEEMVSARETMTEVIKIGLAGSSMNITANVNTLMAITGVVAYWRGVGGLLDWLFEDSLEGYVICTVFGLGVVFVVRALNLPIVEGKGLL